MDLPGYRMLSMSGSIRPRTPGSTRIARHTAIRIVACRGAKPVGTPDAKIFGAQHLQGRHHPLPLHLACFRAYASTRPLPATPQGSILGSRRTITQAGVPPARTRGLARPHWPLILFSCYSARHRARRARQAPARAVPRQSVSETDAPSRSPSSCCGESRPYQLDQGDAGPPRLERRFSRSWAPIGALCSTSSDPLCDRPGVEDRTGAMAKWSRNVVGNAWNAELAGTEAHLVEPAIQVRSTDLAFEHQRPP